MTVFWRYWLLQVPGWLALAGALAAAHSVFELSPFWALVVFVAWFLKDAAFYPILKKHYQFRQVHPSETLLGRRAVAQEPLTPRGYVRLRGELWMAELGKDEPPVAPGDEVTIEAVDGLTLRVRRHESSESRDRHSFPE